MTTFGLVHGAWHGAWCWTRVVDALEEQGHRAIAMDLPCDDPTATFDTYANVVIDALEGLNDVVLVGHSMAGQTIPIVASLRPVRNLVFLCALLALPGQSLVDQFGSEPDMLVPGYDTGLGDPDEAGRQEWADEDAAVRVMYGDCTERDASDALRQLRPQAFTPYLEPCSLTAFPDGDRTYILCTEDRLVAPDWSRAVARDRLGVDAIELPGSHSPFLSRPGAVTEILLSLA